MAQNLRELLRKKVPGDYGQANNQMSNNFGGDSFNGEVGDLLPRYPLEGYNTIYITAARNGNMSPRHRDGHDGRDEYHNTYYPDWCIPEGSTDVIFELWGGGGAGAGNCCCFSGAPGGSGAYAYKRLIGDEVVPGCAYQICVAGISDRTASCSGRRGCKTYVIGHNLATIAVEGYNFCAEGGHGGNSRCRGCCNQGVNIWPRYGCTECTSGCCAQYYGADYGAHGLPGYYFPRSDDDRCCNQWGLPYPGGLMNSRGGWIHIGQRCTGRNCASCEQSAAQAQVGVGGSYCRSYVPGMGGSTAFNCENGVYCGQAGNPGMVRISWK